MHPCCSAPFIGFRFFDRIMPDLEMWLSKDNFCNTNRMWRAYPRRHRVMGLIDKCAGWIGKRAQCVGYCLVKIIGCTQTLLTRNIVKSLVKSENYEYLKTKHELENLKLVLTNRSSEWSSQSHHLAESTQRFAPTLPENKSKSSQARHRRVTVLAE